jgi:hypothetical protein
MKVEIHGNICDGIKDTYKAKNADYGDSFAKVRKEYPEVICIRLMDKLERLKVLVAGNEQQVKDESIEDTLLDLANYCIMEVVERRLDSMKVVAHKTAWHGDEGANCMAVEQIVAELMKAGEDETW